MLLCIDVGNTKISLGFYNKTFEVKGFLCKRNATTEEIILNLRSAAEKKQINGCIISSVVDELTEKVKEAVKIVFNINAIILSTDLNLGFQINSEHPESCGADRLANVCGAINLYKNRPLIVIDSGTATTFDIIDKNNCFLGGSIMPGMDMQLKALGDNTSKLPILNLKDAKDNLKVVTNNTFDAMYSGVVVAHSQAVQGMIKLCEQELNEPVFVVGTGGNVNLVNKYMTERKFDAVNPELTFEGMRIIYNSATKH